MMAPTAYFRGGPLDGQMRAVQMLTPTVVVPIAVSEHPPWCVGPPHCYAPTFHKAEYRLRSCTHTAGWYEYSGTFGDEVERQPGQEPADQPATQPEGDAVP